LELLASQGGETVGTAAEIDGLRRHQHLHTCRNRDHVAAFTARSTSRSQAGSTPGAARTTAPPISIVIAVASCADAAAVIPSWRSSVTIGTNIGASSAGKLSKPARAPGEQVLRRDVVPARHLRHDRPGRIGFRRNPSLGLVTPATPTPHPDPDIDPAPWLRRFNYMVDHICDSTSRMWPASSWSSRVLQGGAGGPLTLRRAQFGRSSEKIERTIEQLELMLEDLETETAAPVATPDAPACDIEPSSSTNGKKSGRKPLPAHLPRREVVHEPSCTCPACGGEMRKVGEGVTEVLDYIPGHFEVIRHIRPAFSCRQCETMVQTPMPSLPIVRGQPSAGVLAHVLVGKYCDHLPLYRQSGIYACEGVELDRATLADWVGKAAALVSPLIETIAHHVMAAEKLCRFWRRARARPEPDGYECICAMNGPMAAGHRLRSSIATLLLARASIRARIWPSSGASCRPMAIPALAHSTRAPAGSRPR
jgi:transposase